MANLLFITTSSLASNPRVVKEFENLKNDYACFVLFFKHKDWSLELSEAIKLRNPEVHFIEIDRYVLVFQTMIAKAIHKIAILFNRLISKSFKVCAFASDDKAPQLWFMTKKLSKKYNFSHVIAHNLGSFYAAVKLSDKMKVRLQLDIEDYYPGIALYFNKSIEEQNRMRIMAHSFLKADTITYASEGILLECKKHFISQNKTEHTILINTFNASDFMRPEAKVSNKIRCVWFSQYIALNRGLEEVFQAAEKLPDVEFHLIGNCKNDFENEMDIRDNIIIHDVMEQLKLHTFLASMDVGLALEPGKDLNNTIALSNKMIAYAQAGCYILSTNTFGQSQFLNSLNYQAGQIINSNLADSLQKLDTNLLNLPSKIERWQKAKLFSWENEQLKLKQLIQ